MYNSTLINCAALLKTLHSSLQSLYRKVQWFDPKTQRVSPPGESLLRSSVPLGKRSWPSKIRPSTPISRLVAWTA